MPPAPPSLLVVLVGVKLFDGVKVGVKLLLLVPVTSPLVALLVPPWAVMVGAKLGLIVVVGAKLLDGVNSLLFEGVKVLLLVPVTSPFVALLLAVRVLPPLLEVVSPTEEVPPVPPAPPCELLSMVGEALPLPVT